MHLEALDRSLVTSLNAPHDASVAAELVRAFSRLGVRHAFGICGGAVGPLWDQLELSDIQLIQVRHETSAGFAAMEASFAADRPALVVATTGPGLTNALTGVFAARWDGAKVIFISGRTPAAQRGRSAFQETTAAELPSALFAGGQLFDYTAVPEDTGELPQIMRQIALGLSRVHGFTAHLCLTPTLQKALTGDLSACLSATRTAPTASPDAIAACADLLASEPFAIWVGFGARRASHLVRSLAERTGAPVLCSARAKGIFPEKHPLFKGVTSIFGGHPAIEGALRAHGTRRILVLGSRLGESTSCLNERLLPPMGFIQVDVDPEAIGASYPQAPTTAIHAELGGFLRSLLEVLPVPARPAAPRRTEPPAPPPATRSAGPVRPAALMAALQRLVVDSTNAIILGDPGNSFAWTNHLLRFQEPCRYRVSLRFASMGTAAAGVLGAALASGRKAVAVVGDGAMLMTNEISTAVQYGIPAVWIILNDARYGMVEQGQRMHGYAAGTFEMPPVDFAQIARAMGAEAARVSTEDELEGAIGAALAARGPFLVDVTIDRTVPAPFGRRL